MLTLPIKKLPSIQDHGESWQMYIKNEVADYNIIGTLVLFVVSTIKLHFTASKKMRLVRLSSSNINLLNWLTSIAK